MKDPTPGVPELREDVYVLSQIWVSYKLNAGKKFIQSGGLFFHHIETHSLNLHCRLLLQIGLTHAY